MQLLSVESGAGGTPPQSILPHRYESESNPSHRGEQYDSIPSHPLGIKPSGNQYSATTNSRNSIGTFQSLPDEIIFMILETFDVDSLIQIGSACKFFYALSRSDELWKAIFLKKSDFESKQIKWQGSWRNTVLGIDSKLRPSVRCENVFSDVLYRPFLCTHTSLAPYTSDIPSQNSIPRLDDMTLDEFSSNWSDKPFILEKPVKQWPVYSSWDLSRLLRSYGHVIFRAEAVDWPLNTYIDYMNDSSDESPLYLFDRAFVEKMGLTVGNGKENSAYWIPDCFGEDLFAVLEDDRPDSRWLIIGPARGGSTFHKDPNATSAWNAVLRGSKYWIMFPSKEGYVSPPGVFMSADQSEVTSPLSIAEWLLGFHKEARNIPGCKEGICGAGEILHVPSGWWHLVVNLEPSVAVTQNFVPRSHLTSVLSFLKEKHDQVSGFKKEVTDPYTTFVHCMESRHPDLLNQALSELELRAVGKKRKWDVAVGKKETEQSFSFGFGGDGDSDEEVD